jgi:Family of unknown function (DUF6055)
MVRLRFLVLVLFAVIALDLGAGTAAARPIGYPDTLTSDHFVIHYAGDLVAPDRITAQTAASVAEIAERAYSAEITSYGYPAPLDDGDGKIDIWVGDLGGPLGFAAQESSGNQSQGYIALDVAGGLNEHTIGHELFHLIQYATFIPDDGWLLESTAEWMGFRFEGFPLDLEASLRSPDTSLDCIGDKCGNDVYETNGYSRWTFFEYLAEHYGGAIVKDVFTRGATLGDPTIPGIQLIADTIAAKGSTLQNVFTDWTVANLTGNYTALGLKGLLPTPTSDIFTGLDTGPLPAQHVAVNHLAARYLAFERGDGTGSGPCYAATLSLTVKYPSSLAAKPYFYWPASGGTAVPFSGTAGSVSVNVPWDTCTWDKAGYLVVQNPSTTLDAQTFTVTGSITVDTTTPAGSQNPPTFGVPGISIPAPTSAVPPTLTIHAPELLRVSAKDRKLRLVVFSNGSGKLRATLGSLELGTSSLRVGNNDVRYTLPASLVKSLRKTSGNNVLRLTSFSPQGTEGTTVTRRVVVQPVKKPKRRP